jgi:hypothetical protein
MSDPRICESTKNDPVATALKTGFFHAADIPLVVKIALDEGVSAGSRYDAFRHAHMLLPEWFELGLDPYSAEYREQQLKLWQLIADVDRPYQPTLDEKEAPLANVDAVRRPGYFIRRDADAVSAASDHMFAQAMIHQHSALKPGDWALEYGAGFGLTALSLARLGVNVDTVDISQTFCDYVTAQADFFQVPLTARLGEFGLNPRPLIL